MEKKIGKYITLFVFGFLAIAIFVIAPLKLVGDKFPYYKIKKIETVNGFKEEPISSTYTRFFYLEGGDWREIPREAEFSIKNKKIKRVTIWQVRNGIFPFLHSSELYLFS